MTKRESAKPRCGPIIGSEILLWSVNEPGFDRDAANRSGTHCVEHYAAVVIG
jgi:hypothetical protein